MYAATRGPNVKWGAHISNGEDGNHCPPAGDGPGRGLLATLRQTLRNDGESGCG